MGGGIARASGVHARAALAVLLSGCMLEQAGRGAESVDSDPVASLDAGVASRDAAQDDAPERHALDAGTNETGAAGRDADASSPLDAGPSCSFAGTFAMMVELDLAWPASGASLSLAALPRIAAGSGTMVFYGAAHVRGDDGVATATLVPCGLDFPDLRGGSAFAPEVYGVYVPEVAWESAAMPRFDLAWRPACVEPGCRVRALDVSGWLGAAGTSIAAPRAELRALDADGDGSDGLAVFARHGGEQTRAGERYTQPPLDPAPLLRLRRPRRAHALMLAVGLEARFEGEEPSCDRGEGAAYTGAVRTAVFGCTSEEGDSLSWCPPALVRALEASLPAWHVRGARYRIERSDDDRCESVRARFTGR